MPSEALLLIEHYFLAFKAKVFACSDSESFCPHELMDAYSRFARLRERFVEEASMSNITLTEKAALERVFEDDVFTEGMMHLRNIADHSVIRSRNNANLRTPDRVPITIEISTSAGQIFNTPTAYLPTMQNTDYTSSEIEINHVDWLTRLAENVERAIGRAKNSLLQVR